MDWYFASSRRRASSSSSASSRMNRESVSGMDCRYVVDGMQVRVRDLRLGRREGLKRPG